MKVGMKVWFLRQSKKSTMLQEVVDRGVIIRITNIDDRGASNNYADIGTKSGIHHLPMRCVFLKKPQYTEIEDEYGKTFIWK